MTISASLVVLTLNEERTIRGCLSSITGSIDDIHVLDSGSTDRTVEIAQQMGARTTIRRPDGPFIITSQRNWALDNLDLRHDWVLFLDSDERATPEFMAEVSAACASSSSEAFWAAPKFMYQGSWLKRYMGYPNWHPRLMRRSAVRLVGGVWETFPANVETARLRAPYIHDANSKGLDDWITRHLRYAHWEANSSLSAESDDIRRKGQRKLLRATGPLRPLVGVAYQLIARGGFLDGGSAWSYARRHLIYELLIREAARERRLQSLDDTREVAVR
jgi:glycosyltransferase involved in cell wall biosynthesis